jgi:circadian clock protein KaiC
MLAADIVRPETSGSQREPADSPIQKKLTGIRGFDEITNGGLPANRLTAIVGSAGAGKTVFALQTLVNRWKSRGESCIFVTFEEPLEQIRGNAASFDWGSAALSEPHFQLIDARMPADADVSGAFDLSALLAGLTALKAETGACNVVFDGIDMLLSNLLDERLERQEMIRLDAWIRESEMSALVTVKSFGLGVRDQLRADFVQYMTDCVVVLSSTFTETAASRTLRVSKYRGSGFAANPVPVVISRSGFDLVVFKGARLDYPTFADRVSSGVTRLDALLNGGYLRGSSVLISGSPGTSKTSLGASFVSAACARGDKALLVSFDESGSQIIANMQSIGIDLKPYIAAGCLTLDSLLSSGRSPEEHYVTIGGLLELHQPDCLVIDPISSLLKADYPFSGMICESLLDKAKSLGITVLCTSLLDQVGSSQELSTSQVSEIADTWIHVSYIAHDGERNRAITIIKSRGTDHSNQVRELVLSQSGVDLVDVYVAEGEVLMGSARAQKEAEADRLLVLDELDAKRRRLNLDREVAELKALLQTATKQLEWKEQEAEFLNVSEIARLEMGRAAAIHRLDLRRSGDDATSDIRTQPGRMRRPL